MSKHFSHQLLDAQRKRKNTLGVEGQNPGDRGVLPLPEAVLPKVWLLPPGGEKIPDNCFLGREI